MPCCLPSIVPFEDQDEMQIAYTAEMVADYGNQPKVEVWIRDVDGSYYNTLHVGVRKAIVGFPVATQIHIYLGGPATGYIRIQ